MAWKVLRESRGQVNSLDNDWLLETLLENRGIISATAKEEYLEPTRASSYSPFTFKDIKWASQMIIKARNKNKQVYIFGDYDVDGITSTVLLILSLRKIGLKVNYYIPKREDEGCGLEKIAIDYIAAAGGDLIITVDTCVSSVTDVEYAKKLGVDIIVTDHHKEINSNCYGELPIINPKLEAEYPYKELAGVGVAYKLAEAVYTMDRRDRDELKKYLELVMLGTIADVVEVTGENRYLIKEGFKEIRKTRTKGIKFLAHYLRINLNNIKTTDVSFYIAPLLNSLGRFGQAHLGVEFFLTRSDRRIYELIEEMKRCNRKRRDLERELFQKVEESLADEDSKYIFLAGEDWHPGIIGVVASRLALKYCKPVILISIKDGLGKGSCRSVAGHSIFEDIQKNKDCLIHYGGHDLATGFMIKEENITILKERLFKVVKEIIPHEKKSTLEIDTRLDVDHLNKGILALIGRVAPFGQGNRQVLFLSEGVKIRNIDYFGVGSRHFKCDIIRGDTIIKGLGFELGKREELEDNDGKTYNIAYYPEEVTSNGATMLQLRIKDFKIDGTN